MKLLVTDNLSVQIAEYLTNKIIELDLKPGERIREHQVASELGVSRSPVREAILIVEKTGLVEIIPRCGTCVTSLSCDYVEGLGDVLCELFGLIVRQ